MTCSIKPNLATHLKLGGKTDANKQIRQAVDPVVPTCWWFDPT